MQAFGVNDRDFALVSPGRDRPVGSDALSTPVKLEYVLNLLSRRERLSLHLVGANVERIDAARSHPVNAVSKALLLALGGVASSLPRVCSHEDFLSHFGLDLYDMPSAGRTAPWPATIGTCLVIEHQEMITVPARRVIAHNSRLALIVVIFNSHKENTIVNCSFCCASLCPQLGRPQLTRVAIVARVALGAPWVAHLDHARSIR